MKYLAIVPARGGSKGLPGKNIRLLAGKPLLAWSIEHARAVPEICEVIVSTDSETIADVAREFGAAVPFIRPAHLAQDDTQTEPVMSHALEWYAARHGAPDAIVLLQPTSPVRHEHSLRGAIAQFERDGADSLLSVCENHHFFWVGAHDPKALYDFEHRPLRQEIRAEDRWYRENGSIYITRTALFREKLNRLGGRISIYVMSEEESWEIDNWTDFRICEVLMEERK